MVALSTGSLPSGITAQLSTQTMGGGGGRTTLTVKAAGTVAAGNYSITITGVGGGVTPNPQVTITVAVSGFSVTTGVSSMSLVRSASLSMPVQTSVTGGFSSPLTLTVTGLPVGVSAAFAPSIISYPATGSSSMKLTASPLALTGTRTITVVATSPNGAVRTTPVTLTVH
jgi:hypothetical protein